MSIKATVTRGDEDISVRIVGFVRGDNGPCAVVWDKDIGLQLESIYDVFVEDEEFEQEPDDVCEDRLGVEDKNTVQSIRRLFAEIYTTMGLQTDDNDKIRRVSTLCAEGLRYTDGYKD